MRIEEFCREAEYCRQQAADLQDKPEGPLLLRVALLFDELASSWSSSGPDVEGSAV
jgi:hypothetical protein